MERVRWRGGRATYPPAMVPFEAVRRVYCGSNAKVHTDPPVGTLSPV